jgi:hypothetical protein
MTDDRPPRRRRVWIRKPKETWTYDDVIRRVEQGPDPPPVRKPDRRNDRARAQCRAGHVPSKRARCACTLCAACCLATCKQKGARAQSACLRCAWCVVCRRYMRFEDLQITGPDLCLACRAPEED